MLMRLVPVTQPPSVRWRVTTARASARSSRDVSTVRSASVGLVVRVGDAGELRQQAGARLGVQALEVAPLALVEGGGDVDEDEVAHLLRHLAHRSRLSAYGAMGAQIATPPWRATSAAT